MIKAISLLVLIALAFGVQLPQAVVDTTESAESVWIVIFHPNTSRAEIAAHHARFQHKVKFFYEISDFRGYAAPMNASTIKETMMSPEVSYVEEDQVVSISQSCGIQQAATWGLDRINERAVKLNGEYTYTQTGAGIRSYIVDTGIYLAHQDFEGRAIFGGNFAGDGNNNDCNGHGTHVAGTVGSKTWGVAKKTTLIAVKVLDCNGSGTNAGVIAGVAFVATDAKGRPSVANMSLGGSKSTALNAAVAKTVASGVTFVVAAGNDNADACFYSPASEPLAISVGATVVNGLGVNQQDGRSSFSNWGKCTDIFAPGTMITSTWIGSPNAIETISGTSMAAPHVAGAAALLLAENNARTPSQVATALYAASTNGVINLACGTNSGCNSSPNKLLFTTTCA